MHIEDVLMRDDFLPGVTPQSLMGQRLRDVSVQALLKVASEHSPSSVVHNIGIPRKIHDHTDTNSSFI